MDLQFRKNQTFIWTVSLALWATLFPLGSCQYKMMVRKDPDDQEVVFSFSSEFGSNSAGSIAFDPIANLLTFTAPVGSVINLPSDSYLYDVQLIHDDFVKVLTDGTLQIVSGVTR